MLIYPASELLKEPKLIPYVKKEAALIKTVIDCDVAFSDADIEVLAPLLHHEHIKVRGIQKKEEQLSLF